MSSNNRSEVTSWLIAHSEGDPKVAEDLLPLVYGKLCALAGRMMRDERAGHTLEPTGLVHEAYLRLVDIERIDWKGKTHFFAMAARQMRRVLIDHARKRGAKKRGGGLQCVTLTEGAALGGEDRVDLLAIHEALEKLERRNERRCRVAEMRLFGGLRTSEIAHVLRVSERTVKQDWQMARAWLARELASGSERGGAA